MRPLAHTLAAPLALLPLSLSSRRLSSPPALLPQACWALSNATSGGSAAQIAYLVGQGVVYPITKMLEVEDARIVMVALEGLENILRSGKAEADRAGGVNPHLRVCREAGVDEALLGLQHAPANIYNKAISISDTYFGNDDDGDDGGDDGGNDDGGGGDGDAGVYGANLNANNVGFGGVMQAQPLQQAWQVPGPAAFAFAPAPGPAAPPAAWGGGMFGAAPQPQPPAPGGGGGGGGAFAGGFSFS